MPRWADRAERHPALRASPQKSLLPPSPNTRGRAPVSSTRPPNGVTFCFAGGSWSSPFNTRPSLSVRVFPPAAVVAGGHLRLGIDGALPRLGVVPDLLADGLDVGEDGVGGLGLLQRL